MRHTKSSVARYVALAIVLAVGPALALAQDRPSDSIKVHGHWVIEVHNRDGSLASRTEFENALVPSSASPFLANLLARNVSVGFWNVTLAANGGPLQPCSISAPLVGGTVVFPCNITEPNNPYFHPHSLNLAVTAPGGALQLSGSVTAENDAPIQVVSTQFVQCAPTINAAASCPSALDGTFTSRLLSQPIPVAAGQIVQVTVTISFS